MKRFVFFSDFDGTLTSRDFYHIVIDKYMGQAGRDFYQEWKKTQKINVTFLNKVFSNMHLSEQALREEILQIPLDPAVKPFLDRLRANDGDFYILSAGTSYYIHILFEALGMSDIPVISMKGVYHEGGILIQPDTEGPFYSPVFGLDKRKALEETGKGYPHIFFAGDSEPDLAAAKAAHTAFARNELAMLMEKEGLPFIPYNSFSDISDYLMREGWFK